MTVSRRYTIYDWGENGLWSAENIIGPEKPELVITAFFNWYLGRRGKYCLFISPVTLDVYPFGPQVIEYLPLRGNLPGFDSNKVIKNLFPDLEDPFEYIDDVKFKKKYESPI